MSVLLGMALAVFPFTTLPAVSMIPGEPVLAELGADPAQLRQFCYSTRCGDEEWQRGSPLSPSLSFNATRKARPSLPGSQRWISLWAPARPRDGTASYSNNWRVGTRYHVHAVRDGPTRLGLQLGAGYRLAPLQDDGIGHAGAVLRGEVDFGHRISDRANWTQRIQFEAGQNGSTFVKQTFGLDVSLWPEWTLESDFQIRHAETGRTGSDSAESSLKLRRRF